MRRESKPNTQNHKKNPQTNKTKGAANNTNNSSSSVSTAAATAANVRHTNSVLFVGTFVAVNDNDVHILSVQFSLFIYGKNHGTAIVWTPNGASLSVHVCICVSWGW